MHRPKKQSENIFVGFKWRLLYTQQAIAHFQKPYQQVILRISRLKIRWTRKSQLTTVVELSGFNKRSLFEKFIKPFNDLIRQSAIKGYNSIFNCLLQVTPIRTGLSIQPTFTVQLCSYNRLLTAILIFGKCYSRTMRMFHCLH